MAPAMNGGNTEVADACNACSCARAVFLKEFGAELRILDNGEHVPDQSFFRDQVYQRAKAKGIRIPWDLGRPQSALACVSEVFQGCVLDVGCGLGDNALWLGSLPSVTSVSAVDISQEAVEAARARQASAPPEAAAKVTFSVADVFSLPFPKDQGGSFDVMLDSAVFHCIGDDDAQARYLAAVTPHISRGGKVVMLAMSDRNPDPWNGPRRISRQHATRTWTAAGWRVDRIDDVRFDLPYSMPNLPGHAILMQATRVA